MGKCSDCSQSRSHRRPDRPHAGNPERCFNVPLSFRQVLVESNDSSSSSGRGDRFVPLSTLPGVIYPGISGRFLISFNETYTQALFRLYVFNAIGITSNFVRSASLRKGRADVNGPLIVSLFTSGISTGTPVNGLLSEGVINNANVHRVAGINSVTSLFDAIRRGYIYVNVTTVGYREGAIRGQIFARETTA